MHDGVTVLRLARACRCCFTARRSPACPLDAVSSSLSLLRPIIIRRRSLPGRHQRTSASGFSASRRATCLPENGRRPAPPALIDRTPQLSGLRLGDYMSGAEPLPAAFLHDLKDTRRASLREFADGFVYRKNKRASETPDGARIRLHNPLVVLQSAPGGGKSTVLDAAAILSTHGLWSTFCSDADMCTMLHSSVPITVTINDDLGADTDTRTGVALRILHSFFAPTMDFASFAKLLPQGGWLTVEDAICCCRAALPAHARGRGVLLLLDVVLTLGSRVEALLSVLGSPLDTFPSEELNVVCTTLNARAFSDLSTRSGRPVVWAPLPALEQASAERMVAQALQLGQLPRALRVVLSDCSGHSRSLQYVLEAAQQLCAADPEGWSADDQRLLQQLRAAAVQHLKPTAPWAIRAALEGLHLSLNEPVRGACSRALREHITNGTFNNTDISKGWTVVPKISMLRLLASCGSGRISGHLGAALRELADVDAAALANTRPLMGGKPFEAFVARWLCVRLLLAADDGDKGMSLRKLLLDHLRGFRCIGAHLSRAIKSAQLRLTSDVRVEWKDCTFQDALMAPGCQLKDNVIYTFGGDNPGFDSLILFSFQEGGASQRMALAFESCFSMPHSLHGDERTKVDRRVQLWQEQQQLLLAKCGVPPEHSVLVYLAVRDVHLDGASSSLDAPLADNRERLEKVNVIVLDRSASAALFTPTLADSVFFTLDLAAAAAGQQHALRN